MKKWKIVFCLVLVSIFLVSCENGQVNNYENGAEVETELTVSAAISLTDVLNELKEIYEEKTTTKLTFNFGGSGTLTQQIQQGAPVDIFISADVDWMDDLDQKELIVSATRADLTSNDIVLIANETSSFDVQSMEDITSGDVNQIAIGNPESVPAGKYTEQLLRHLDLWNELKNQFVLAKDVRQVLTYVESGNADIGFVYKSDAFLSDHINILAEADEAWHDPITYPGAVLRESAHQVEAADFLDFLKTNEAQEVFQKYGFKK